jgi:hypothetical protein
MTSLKFGIDSDGELTDADQREVFYNCAAKFLGKVATVGGMHLRESAGGLSCGPAVVRATGTWAMVRVGVRREQKMGWFRTP